MKLNQSFGEIIGEPNNGFFYCPYVPLMTVTIDSEPKSGYFYSPYVPLNVFTNGKWIPLDPPLWVNEKGDLWIDTSEQIPSNDD